VLVSSIPPPPPPSLQSGSAGAQEDAGTARPDRGWGPGRAFGGILVLLVLISVEAGIISAFDPNLKAIGAKLGLQALLALTLAGVAFAMASPRGGLAAPAALGLQRPERGALRLAFAAYLAYFAFAIAYSALVSPHQKDLTRDLGYGDGAAASIIAGLLIVLAAPISEEIFFRGFLFGGLRRRLPFVLAAVISAAIFGAFHYTGPGSLTVLPQLAMLGLTQAWLYERSGSIYPTMAVHVINNALAFAILTQ
jgi:membrane protease YdiL (CAAX protease family)